LEQRGIYVVNRKDKGFDDSANQLAEQLFSFVKLNSRDRITQRNRVENSAAFFDWKVLGVHYDKAYALAEERHS
jgi:glycogen(starch) synthase